MPRAILPVKRPETDPGIIPRRQRVTFRLQESKRQKSTAGFKIEIKKHDRDPDAEEIFCRVQIQNLIVDVIQVSVIGDASGKAS
jgi:hypothetical protein